MPHENTLMRDVLKFIPWGRFDCLVEKHGADRRVRALTSKSQLVALLDAQLSGASSLRDVVATSCRRHAFGMTASHEARLHHLGVSAPKRSTLADAVHAKHGSAMTPTVPPRCSATFSA